jgi:hypothetical protein
MIFTDSHQVFLWSSRLLIHNLPRYSSEIIRTCSLLYLDGRGDVCQSFYHLDKEY